MREANDKGLELALALPISRSAWYLGKLIGFACVGAVIAALFALPLLAWAAPADLAAWCLALAVEAALVAAAALFFASALGADRGGDRGHRRPLPARPLDLGDPGDRGRPACERQPGGSVRRAGWWTRWPCCCRGSTPRRVATGCCTARPPAAELAQALCRPRALCRAARRGRPVRFEPAQPVSRYAGHANGRSRRYPAGSVPARRHACRAGRLAVGATRRRARRPPTCRPRLRRRRCDSPASAKPPRWRGSRCCGCRPSIRAATTRFPTSGSTTGAWSPGWARSRPTDPRSGYPLFAAARIYAENADASKAAAHARLHRGRVRARSERGAGRRSRTPRCLPSTGCTTCPSRGATPPRSSARPPIPRSPTGRARWRSSSSRT